MTLHKLFRNLESDKECNDKAHSTFKKTKYYSMSKQFPSIGVEQAGKMSEKVCQKMFYRFDKQS